MTNGEPVSEGCHAISTLDMTAPMSGAMSVPGQTRPFKHAALTSGLPRLAEIRKVPSIYSFAGECGRAENNAVKLMHDLLAEMLGVRRTSIIPIAPNIQKMG